MQLDHQDPHDAPPLSLVAPLYSEGEALYLFFARMVPILEPIDGTQFEIVCIDDGSVDNTLPKLVAVSRADPHVRMAGLTHNSGKEATLIAGLDEALDDAAIPIGTGLQGSPELISTLVAHWRKGAKVVLA